MARVHGIRKQDADAMAQFKWAQKNDPVEPKLAGIIWQVPLACHCSEHSDPHHHSPEETRAMLRRRGVDPLEYMSSQSGQIVEVNNAR